MSKKSKKLALSRKHKNATQKLADLNRELATKMILLASQTGDVLPLKQAVDALHSAEHHYSHENAPRELLEVRRALADTLFTLGRVNKDAESLKYSITAYRNAITLASLLGDDELRHKLRSNYNRARDLYAELKPKRDVRGAA